MTTLAYPLCGSVVSGNARGPILATFLWRDDDPYTVILWFPSGQCWMVGRDLLAQGVEEEAGDREFGDMLIRPVDEGIEFRLRSPRGEATLVFDHGQVSTALDATKALIPLGSEELNWDVEMRLLGGAR
jgi:hypothetical protein